MDQLPTEQKQSQLAELPDTPPSTPSQPLPRQKFRDLNADQVYDLARPRAQKAKVVVQMIIGIILGAVLLLKAINYLLLLFGVSFPPILTNVGPLDLVSYALFFSTGIELAYMLFTPGPDEAIEPVITGLAAAILLFLSNSKLAFNTDNGFGLLLAILALGVLFALRHIILKPRPPKQES